MGRAEIIAALKERTKYGIINHVKMRRGYGFISPLDGREDVFFLVRDAAIEDYRIVPGLAVSYQLRPDTDPKTKDRTFRAICIQEIKDASIN